MAYISIHERNEMAARNRGRVTEKDILKKIQSEAKGEIGSLNEAGVLNELIKAGGMNAYKRFNQLSDSRRKQFVKQYNQQALAAKDLADTKAQLTLMQETAARNKAARARRFTKYPDTLKTGFTGASAPMLFRRTLGGA
jgi:hypothetical protein